MSRAEDAAAAVASEIIVASAEGDPNADSSGSETTDETADAELEFPTFEVELPADIQALLAEDDTDLTVTDDELDELSEEHEDVPRDVLARMRKAEKKAEHYERLRAQENKKTWGEEAKKYFGFSEPFLDQIEATSRRGFMNTAKQIHERMKPLVEERVLKPARDAIAAEKAKATTEAKEEAKAAWGTPISENEEKDSTVSDAFTRRRGRRDFNDTVRGMLFDRKEE
jgi:hypothetical protein